MTPRERYFSYIDHWGWAMVFIGVVFEMAIRLIILIVMPPCCYANNNSSCYFVFGRNHEMTNKDQCYGYKGSEAMLQTLLVYVNNVDEEVNLMNQFMKASRIELEREKDPCDTSCFQVSYIYLLLKKKLLK